MLQLSHLLTKLYKIFLGYTTPPCVGLDLGSSALKMVELGENSLQIRKFSCRTLAPSMVNAGVINDIEAVAEIIRRQWQLFKPKYANVAIAIPYNSVIMREIQAPLFKYKYELDEHVQAQLISELDNEQISFDYTLVEVENNLQHLSVVVAKTEKIEEYQALMQMTGMQVAAIEVEPFALAHLFSLIFAREQRQGQTLVIDIGLSRVCGYVFENNRHLHFNEINVDYQEIIESILAANFSEAELKQLTDPYAAVTDLIYKQNVAASSWNSAILADVTKLIQLLSSNILVDKMISLNREYAIILLGGNALLPDLALQLSQQLKQPVMYAAELLADTNPSIALSDLNRLFSAIALATWGQQIGTD